LPNFKQNLMLALCSTAIFRWASEQYCYIQGQNTWCSDASALKLQTATAETSRILTPQLANSWHCRATFKKMSLNRSWTHVYIKHHHLTYCMIFMSLQKIFAWD
jgi:hypothetical protein